MTEPTVSFQPFQPGFTDDPYPHYAELRAHRPVEHSQLGLWVLWRHADVKEMLKARLSVEDRNVRGFGSSRTVYDAVYGEGNRGSLGAGMSMLDRDPPDHTRLRRLVSRAFNPRTIEQLIPVIQSYVDEALDRIADGGTIDLVDTLAFPLPFAVISTMLGMPEDDVDRLRELSGLMVRSLEPVPDDAMVKQIVDATIEVDQRTSQAIAWKRKHPADDLLTALINAEDDGDVLSDAELIAQVVLLYVAGHETTVGLISNGALALRVRPIKQRCGGIGRTSTTTRSRRCSVMTARSSCHGGSPCSDMRLVGTRSRKVASSWRAWAPPTTTKPCSGPTRISSGWTGRPRSSTSRSAGASTTVWGLRWHAAKGASRWRP
jgi:cytochrome P450